MKTESFWLICTGFIFVAAIIGLFFLGIPFGPSISPPSLKSQGSLAGSGNQLPLGDDYVVIASGSEHHLALRANGSIICWGDNRYGQCDVPQENGFIAIATKKAQNLAVRSNGTIVCWGANLSQLKKEIPCIPPPGNDYIGIAAGDGQNLALRSDGTIVQWGDNRYGQDIIPAGHDFIALASGRFHNIALRSNGTIVCWGASGYCDVPYGNDYVTVSASDHTSLALKSDGKVVSWGYEYGNGQNYWHDAPPFNDFVAISDGDSKHFALRSDGSVVCWGGGPAVYCNTPPVSDAIAITTNIAITNPRAKEILAVEWQKTRARITLEPDQITQQSQSVRPNVYGVAYAVNSTLQDVPDTMMTYTINNPENFTQWAQWGGVRPGDFRVTSVFFLLYPGFIPSDPYHFVPYRNFTIKSPSKATEEFKTHELAVDESYTWNNGPVADADRIVITNITLGYIVRPTSQDSYVLQPAYGFNGYVEKGSARSSFLTDYVLATENLVEFDFLEKEGTLNASPTAALQ